tara:strand:+ start:3502 stop:4035 length:534 start_codon:yes stop_codon:yes gene_type:complete
MLKYVCPLCGDTRLEEIMSNVQLSSVIADVSEGGDIDYEDAPGSAGDSGIVSRYQCVNCGQQLHDVDGEVITDCNDLYKELQRIGQVDDEQPVTFEVSFTAQGHIEQTLQIVDNKYTPDKVMELLKSGRAVTTVQDGGDVLLVVMLGEDGDEGVIAKVISSDCHLEYDEFGYGLPVT